jgi:hypothetical protein
MFESHLQIVEYKFVTKFYIQNLDFKIKRKQKKKKKKKKREETPPGPRKPFFLGPTQNHSCTAHLVCPHHSTDGWGPLAVSRMHVNTLVPLVHGTRCQELPRPQCSGRLRTGAGEKSLDYRRWAGRVLRLLG